MLRDFLVRVNTAAEPAPTAASSSAALIVMQPSSVELTWGTFVRDNNSSLPRWDGTEEVGYSIKTSLRCCSAPADVAPVGPPGRRAAQLDAKDFDTNIITDN